MINRSCSEYSGKLFVLESAWDNYFAYFEILAIMLVVILAAIIAYYYLRRHTMHSDVEIVLDEIDKYWEDIYGKPYTEIGESVYMVRVKCVKQS